MTCDDMLVVLIAADDDTAIVAEGRCVLPTTADSSCSAIGAARAMTASSSIKEAGFVAYSDDVSIDALVACRLMGPLSKSLLRCLRICLEGRLGNLGNFVRCLDAMYPPSLRPLLLLLLLLLLLYFSCIDSAA